MTALSAARTPPATRQPGRGLALAGEILITLGVLVLGFLAWQLGFNNLIASGSQHAAASTLSQGFSAAGASGSSSKPVVDTAPRTGKGFAVVRIPRFGASWKYTVAEGVDTTTILDNPKLGLGHYPGTQMPGAIGNFAIAGHRTTYGAPMFKVFDLHKGDPVVVQTKSGWYVYRVTSIQVVLPTALRVLAPVSGHPNATATKREMTITTCTPLYSAAHRAVVHLRWDSWQPTSAGPPAAIDGKG